MSRSSIQKPSKRKLALSALVFFACYLVMLFVIFLMIVLNDPSGWTVFFHKHFSSILSLIVSVFFLFAIAFVYYAFEDAEFLEHLPNIVMMFSLLIVSSVICFFIGRYFHPYARPFAVFAFLALFLFNRRHALFLNFIFSFLIFVIDLFTNTVPTVDINTEIYSSLLLSFISGTFAIFLSGGVKTRGGLLLSGVFIAAPTVIVVLLFNIPEITSNWIDYFSAAGFRMLSCILAAAFALVFLPVFEKIFNSLTVFRLRELTSTSAPLLMRLRDEAPGTFNHSLIVAQLAETCAVAIGENSELARTAAYYHDVGKLKQPDCFTENQGEYNVHDEITPELSADIIRSHAKDGYDLLIEKHLPKAIADVALEHHGTLPIKYFYNKAMRYSGDADIKDFCYLGPIPQTKIAAIIMIADAAEAATRAMSDRSTERLERLCREIIEERMDLGQFDECGITIKELTIIKMTLVDAFTGVHHHRVEYPSIRFNRDRQAVSTEEEHD